MDKINKYKNNTQPHIPIEKKREHLIKAIKKYSKANVVFSMHPQLELGKFFSCPKIMQLHDLFTFIPEIKVLFEKVCPINQINEQVQNNLEEYVKLNSVFITGTSYIAQTQIEKYTSAKKEQIKVIPYPQMLSEDYKEQIVEEKEFRNKYKIEATYFPYPSLNRPNKNFMLILKALNILKQKKFSIKFVTTGSISTIPENEAYVNKHHLENMIIQTGSMPQKDLYALYKYASLVVVPTIIEGPGIPQQVLEPLKIGGIPVICSKCLGCEESLESVGLSFETADLNWVDCDDAQGLADKICSVLSNPKEHIEKQKHIIDFYTKITWKDTAEKYLEIFKELSNS